MVLAEQATVVEEQLREVLTQVAKTASDVDTQADFQLRSPFLAR